MSPNWYGVAAILMWSSTALLLAVSNAVPPLQLVTMSWFLGFVVLGAYYIGKGENLVAHFKRPLSDYLFVGAGICGYTVLIYSSFYHAPPFDANALNYLWPILLTLFLGLFQGVKLTLLKFGGLLLGFGGTVLLFAYRYQDTAFHGLQAGHFMALAGAIVWALYSCFAKNRTYPTAFMVPVFAISILLCFIAHLLFEEFVWPDLNAWVAIVMLGTFRISYVFWDYAIRNGDRQFVSSLAYFAPLLATMLLIAGGFGTAAHVITLAAFMIVAGCLIINFEQIRSLFRKSS